MGARQFYPSESSFLRRLRYSADRQRDTQDRKVLEHNMKVNYDAKTDTLTVVFRDVPVAESDEDKPGVILDYDATGNIVSIEVLDVQASRRTAQVTVQTDE